MATDERIRELEKRVKSLEVALGKCNELACNANTMWASVAAAKVALGRIAEISFRAITKAEGKQP